MKKRNLILISVVAVMGLAALVIFLVGRRSSTFEQNFHVKDTSTITKIFIADNRDHHVVLVHDLNNVSDSAWTVDGKYYASQPLIDMLLETLNGMRIREQVNKLAVPNIIKNLSASNTKVEVYQMVYFINWFEGKFRLFPHEKKTVTYFVGHETQDMMGTYMLRDGDKVPYVIHIPGFRGILNTRFISDPIAWRSHRIVNWDVKSIQRVELDILESPEESFSINREGEGFYMKLASGERIGTFDTARVAQLLSSFTNLNFDEYAIAVPQVELDTTFARAPKTILKVTDLQGTTHEVKTYIKYTNPDDLKTMPDSAMYNTFDINRLYAIVDNKDTVLIQYYIFDNILQPASFFLGHDRVAVAR